MCFYNKDVFFDILRRIIKEKRFEVDYERVNLGVKIKCNGELILYRVLKYKDFVIFEFVKKFVGEKFEFLKEFRDLKEVMELEVSNFWG